MWIWAASLGLLVGGTTFLLWDAWRMGVAYREIAGRSRDQVVRRSLDAQRHEQLRVQKDLELRARDELASAWLASATFPWDELLLSVERLKYPGVRLLTLNVDARQGVARVTLECRDAAQAIDLGRVMDEGRPAGERRWSLARVRALSGPFSTLEVEMNFNVNTSWPAPG